MNDSITKEQVLNAYNSAPDIVRAAFNDEKTTQVIIDLQAKFRLHIDQSGLLGKCTGYMLLGLLPPPEFLEKLVVAGIPRGDAQAIMTEINQKIFVPLREQMQKAPPSTAPAESAEPSVPAEVKYSHPAIPRLVVPTAPTEPKKFFHLQNKIAPPLPRPANPGLRGILASVANPADARKMLEDHEEPHIEFKKAIPKNLPGALPPIAVPKAAAPQGAPIQPRPIAPGARFTPMTPQAVTPAASIPEVRPSFAIPKVEPPKPVAPTTPAPAKPYSADPYREPIE